MSPSGLLSPRFSSLVRVTEVLDGEQVTVSATLTDSKSSARVNVMTDVCVPVTLHWRRVSPLVAWP
jgi:hypothetical protein